MVGSFNNSMVYPIMELIKKELKHMKREEIPKYLDDIPSVELHRESRTDPDEVTGATFSYGGGYTVEMYLHRGNSDPKTFPVGIAKSHPDYHYYKFVRLSMVSSSLLSSDSELLVTVNMEMLYDSKGRFKGVNSYTLK